MDERAEQARGGGSKFLDKLSPRADTGRLGSLGDDVGVHHHALDLLIQLVTVGDDEDASLRIMLHEPLGDQDHQDTLAATLGVPDHAALTFGDAFLG